MLSALGRAAFESVNNIDGIESRESASLKSYTSYSSIEGGTRIRWLPNMSASRTTGSHESRGTLV